MPQQIITDKNDINAKLNWHIFNQNIGIFGIVGFGKTEKMKELTHHVGNKKRWVFDYNNKFNGYGKIAKTVNELDTDWQWIYQGDNSRAAFERFCDKAFYNTDKADPKQNTSNLVLFFDELQQYMRKRTNNLHFDNIVFSGRNKGLCVVYATPTPELVPDPILGVTQHVYAFKMAMRDQIDWFRHNFIGDLAELLLPPNYRRERITLEYKGKVYHVQDLPPLTQHSCIYRDINKLEPVVLGGFEFEPT